MVKVYIKQAEEQPREFHPVDAGELLKLVKNSRFWGAGTVETREGVTLGSTFMLAPDATYYFFPAPGAGPRPNSAVEACKQFWLHLPEATVKDGFLDLKQGTFFLGESSRGSSLLIRKSYTELVDILMDLVNQGTKKIVITGSPGIGKTVCIFYLMYCLVRNSAGKPPVIVLMARDCKVLCFEGGSVKQGTLQSFMAQLGDPDTWLLVDGMTPAVRSAKTVVFTSPNREIYWSFLKQTASTLRYMPVWSLEELEQCRSKLYSDRLTAEEMCSLYERWGGRPRYVLEKALDVAQQQEFLNTLGMCDLKALVQSWGQHSGEETASDRLLEIRVGPDYLTTTMGFASMFVAESVADRLMKLKQEEVQMLLVASEGMATLSTVAGTLFKTFAHMKLCAGGQFEVRELRDGSSSSVVDPERVLCLTSSEPFRFQQLEAVKAVNETKYCQPTSPTPSSIDSLKKPNLLFQMTTSFKHPILLGGLDNAIEALGVEKEAEVRLYFVVPPLVYGTFAAQPLVLGKADQKTADASSDKDASPAGRLTSKMPIRPVRQFALKIEMSSQVKSSGQKQRIMCPPAKCHAMVRQVARTAALWPM